MKKRVLSLVLLLTMVMTTFTGCGDRDTIAQLNNMTSLSGTTSSTKNYKMSYTDEQSQIYAQVSDRSLLDLTALDPCSDNEIQQVVNYMNNVDNQLIGQVSPDNGVIGPEFVNFILAEFEKTPYYWQRSKTTIRGIDAESRAIVVDVLYKTIAYDKDVIPDTSVARGTPNYDTIMANRESLWIQYLNAKISNNPNAMTYLEEFRKYYGEPEKILEAQNSKTLEEYVMETGNQKTYNSLVNNDDERGNAELTIRYILVPNYVLGLNLGMDCKHAYILDYHLDKDFTEGKELFTEAGYATVSDEVYNLIYSYFTCIDEADFQGLNKLTTHFDKWDKYYEDLFNTTYTKHDGFSVSLFDIQGTRISCGITISSKIRAKGSNITFPIYTDKYYCDIDLDDERLKVNDLILISRTLEGEPTIKTDEAETTGFSATIELDNTDKAYIETLIRDFSLLQMKGDTNSDDFAKVVDLTLTNNSLSQLKENMMSIHELDKDRTFVTKATWLEQYQQGTSNYANVKCRELFQDDINAITEVDATYEFMKKGGVWYVYGYNVNSMVKLDTTNLPTTSSLCVIKKGEVLSFISKLKESTETNLDTVASSSVTFEHEPYKPNFAGNASQQGLVLITVDTVTPEQFNQLMENNGLAYTYEDFMAYVGVVYDIDPETADLFEDGVKTLTAYYINILESRYPTDNVTIKENDRKALLDKLDNIAHLLGSKVRDNQEISTFYSQVKALYNRIH